MLDFSRFEILTFDCYGTLVNWEEGILRVLRSILSAHHKQVDDATILKLYGDFEQRLEDGEFRPYREVLRLVVHLFMMRRQNASQNSEDAFFPIDQSSVEGQDFEATEVEHGNKKPLLHRRPAVLS